MLEQIFSLGRMKEALAVMERSTKVFLGGERLATDSHRGKPQVAGTRNFPHVIEDCVSERPGRVERTPCAEDDCRNLTVSWPQFLVCSQEPHEYRHFPRRY